MNLLEKCSVFTKKITWEQSFVHKFREFHKELLQEDVNPGI